MVDEYCQVIYLPFDSIAQFSENERERRQMINELAAKVKSIIDDFLTISLTVVSTSHAY